MGSTASWGSWHRRMGLLGVLVFLATGVYLITQFPQLHGGNAAVRYQYRANHAYILLSSLLNWGIGIYLVGKESGWRRGAQRLGSVLLLAAPAVLLAAFFIEPARGAPERSVTLLGMVLALGGTVLHALARGPAPTLDSEP